MIPIPVHFHLSISCFNGRRVKDTSIVEVCRPCTHECAAGDSCYQNKATHRFNQDVDFSNFKPYSVGGTRGFDSDNLHRRPRYKFDPVVCEVAKNSDCRAASEEVTTWMGEGVDEAEIEDPELYGSAEDVEDEVEEEVTPTELGSDEFGQCDTESEESDADGGNDSGTEGKEDSGEDSEEDGEKGDSEGEESKHSQRPSSTLRELQQKGGSPTHTKWNSQRKQPDAMQQDGQALFTRKRPTSKQPEVEAINRTRDIGARQRAEDSSNPHKRKSSFKRVIKKLIQSITGRNNQPRLENSHDSYAYCSKRKQPMDTERSHVDHRSSRKYRDPSKLGHGKSNAEEYNFSQRCARQPAMSARRDGNNNTHDPKHWSEDDDLIGSKAPYLGDRYRLPQNQSQAKLKTKQQPQPKTKGGKMATKITTFKASRKPSGSANQEMSQPGSCFSANGQSRSFSNAPVQKASRIPRLQRKAA